MQSIPVALCQAVEIEGEPCLEQLRIAFAGIVEGAFQFVVGFRLAPWVPLVSGKRLAREAIELLKEWS